MPSLTSIVQGMLTTSERVSMTKTTFVTHLLPPFLCHYLMGVLVQLEETRFQRLALLPIIGWSSWRATLVDVSGGDATKSQSNSMLVGQMCSICMRSVVWAFARVRYRRLSPASNRGRLEPGSTWTACWNTWDLLINLRGVGWNWPRGLVVPKSRFDTESRIAFVLLSTIRLACHALAFDACLQIIRALGPNTFGSVNGGALFDGSLPLAQEVLRALVVSALGGASAYFGIEYSYKLLAIVCVVLFRQHPSQWPPLFDAPWLSTSLGELWGRRFHQLLRDIILTLGGEPFDYLFGRLGGIIGAFLVSGVIHDLQLRSDGRGGNSLVLIGFWLVNGVGVVLERVWRQVTGRRVGGFWGWLWMICWLAIWGVPTVNEYAKVGRFGSLSLLGGVQPSLAVAAYVEGFF